MQKQLFQNTALKCYYRESITILNLNYIVYPQAYPLMCLPFLKCIIRPYLNHLKLFSIFAPESVLFGFDKDPSFSFTILIRSKIFFSLRIYQAENDLWERKMFKVQNNLNDSQISRLTFLNASVIWNVIPDFFFFFQNGTVGIKISYIITYLLLN